MDANTSDTSQKKQVKKHDRGPLRKIGRPNKELVFKRRWINRTKFKKKYGCDLIAIMMKKGYYMTKQDAKTAARKEALKPKVEVQEVVEVVEQAPKVARDAFAGKEADLVLKGVVNALLAGKLVPGFTLLPEEKAKINKTVEQIVVEKFTPGHPAYRLSLVTIKDEYAN